MQFWLFRAKPRAIFFVLHGAKLGFEDSRAKFSFVQKSRAKISCKILVQNPVQKFLCVQFVSGLCPVCFLVSGPFAYANKSCTFFVNTSETCEVDSLHAYRCLCSVCATFVSGFVSVSVSLACENK